MKIREDGVGGVFMDGLSEHVVRNTDGIMSLLRTGARLRTTGSTKMNKVQMKFGKIWNEPWAGFYIPILTKKNDNCPIAEITTLSGL